MNANVEHDNDVHHGIQQANGGSKASGEDFESDSRAMPVPGRAEHWPTSRASRMEPEKSK